MTHTIDLAPDTERRIDEAAARIGVNMDELIVETLNRWSLTHRDSSRDITEEFKRLVEWWKRETGPISDTTKIAMHPAYQRIIGLGPAAVPLILAELQREPHHWFWALKAITGENPMNREHAGDMQQMADDWLQWGVEKHYLR